MVAVSLADFELLLDGTTYSVWIVGGSRWSVAVFGDIVLVNDTGDSELNRLLATVAVKKS